MASDRDPSSGGYRNEMDRASDNYNPAFNYNYRNGSDIDSDAAYQARRDQDWSNQSDAIQARRLNEDWTVRREQQWIEQSDSILARRAAEALEGRNGLDVQSDAWVAARKVVFRSVRPPVRANSAASEMQRELNRFAAMSEASNAAPVWNMYDASAASRAAQLQAYRTPLARLPGQYVGATDVAAQRMVELRRESLLNFMGGQNGMALGGVMSSGVMIATGDVVAASAVTDAMAPLDSLLAPMGGGGAVRTVAGGPRRPGPIQNHVLDQPRIGSGEKGTGSGNKIDQIPDRPVLDASGGAAICFTGVPWCTEAPRIPRHRGQLRWQCNHVVPEKWRNIASVGRKPERYGWTI